VDIIVCIKRVRLNPEASKSIINPLDKAALEEGLRLKERFSGRVVVLTMGSPPARRALEEALAIGADEAVFLCDDSFDGADTLATAYALFYGIRRLPRFDLILCGNESTTGATGHVGPELAELLGIPHVSYARKLDSSDGKRITVERVFEDGYIKVEIELPALVAVLRGINQPRLPTVAGIMEAAGKKIEVWSAKDISADPERVGLEGSPTRALREVPKTFERKKEIITGPAEEAVKKAVARLKELGVL
jgi:electron transfer flavoprotein beta subunit